MIIYYLLDPTLNRLQFSPPGLETEEVMRDRPMIERRWEVALGSAVPRGDLVLSPAGAAKFLAVFPTQLRQLVFVQKHLLDVL